MPFALALMLIAAAGAAHAEAAESRPAEERVILRTSMGDMLAVLYPHAAPEHVAQILRLVRLGVYNGVFVYRVVPGLLIQVGNAQDRRLLMTPEQVAAIRPIKGEFGRTRHRRGTLSMARAPNDPDGARTSFSIFLTDAPYRDGKYTVFGRLERGYEVLEAIAGVACDKQGRPLERVEIQRTEIATPAALAHRPLRGPIPQVTEVGRSEAAVVTVWAGGLLIIHGLGLFLLAGRLSSGRQRSYGLMAVLAGFFFLFTALASGARSEPWLATGVLVATLGLFRLMTLFENPK